MSIVAKIMFNNLYTHTHNTIICMYAGLRLFFTWSKFICLTFTLDLHLYIGMYVGWLYKFPILIICLCIAYFRRFQTVRCGSLAHLHAGLNVMFLKKNSQWRWDVFFNLIREFCHILKIIHLNYNNDPIILLIQLFCRIFIMAWCNLYLFLRRWFKYALKFEIFNTFIYLYLILYF